MFNLIANFHLFILKQNTEITSLKTPERFSDVAATRK